MPSNRALIKRYTPPTCRLEIYTNKRFSLGNNSEIIPDNFAFKLHFDDPRMLDEQPVVITGDRLSLDKLREKVNDYIAKIMQCPESTILNKPKIKYEKTERNDIYLISKGTLNQELYYFSRGKKNVEKTITLTTLQLFDLSDALDQYKLDSEKSQDESIYKNQKLANLSLVTVLLTCLGMGGIWWYRYSTATRDNLDVIVQQDTPDFSPNEGVIPPNPLNPDTIPKQVALQSPPNLKNRKTLPPPPAVLPRQPLQNTKNDAIVVPKPPNNPITPNQIYIPAAPQRPLNPPISPPPLTISPNLMAITPQSSSNPPASKLTPIPPVRDLTPPEHTAKITNFNSSGNSVPTLPSIPKPSSTKITPPPNFNQNLNTAVSVVPENINKIEPPFTNSSNTQTQSETINPPKQKSVQMEVRQYFEQKWQPPENLDKSIEYRLMINDDGSLQRVVPMGQTAVIFLDKTGIPLQGEKIASSLSGNKSSTVRLILSPDGNVESFLE